MLSGGVFKFGTGWGKNLITRSEVHDSGLHSFKELSVSQVGNI